MPQEPENAALNIQNTTHHLEEATNAFTNPNAQNTNASDSFQPTHVPAPQAQQVINATMQKVSFNPAIIESIAMDGMNKQLQNPQALRAYIQDQAQDMSNDNTIPFELQSTSGRLTMKGVLQCMGTHQSLEALIQEQTNQQALASIITQLEEYKNQLDAYEESQQQVYPAYNKNIGSRPKRNKNNLKRWKAQTTMLLKNKGK